ncbi:MAG: hypothetical protein ACI8RD_003875 [Bacillariaceae sp.]|jgi:hypothetical protein
MGKGDRETDKKITTTTTTRELKLIRVNLPD